MFLMKLYLILQCNLKIKIMELELKHLVPYLPYGLEVIYTHTRERGKIKNLYDIEYYDDIKIGINWMDGEHIWMFKPILRPLSDLTKEIEHNGEKFIPTNILNDYDNGGVSFECDVNGYGKWYMAFFYADGLDSFSFSDFEIIREKLLEWHFDLFGLIEKGLSIDINTLNQ